jgi:hypothetical protein
MKLDFLHTAYALSPPYVSLYLETARDTEHAAKAVDLRWRQARETLEAAGADAATLDAVAEVVTDPGRAAPGRAVFAAGGRVGYTESLPVPPRPIAEWSPLPRALPLLFLRDEPIAHLRVLVDRQGADISVCGSRRHAMTVRGRDWPIQKVREGGWSEPRYQRSAVETWEANAKEVADVVARQADVVLLNDPLEHGPPGTLWFGPAPTALGETEAEARDLGIADPTPEQAGAVLVRAMVGTDVTVETVDRGELDLTDGIGASLRFAI